MGDGPGPTFVQSMSKIDLSNVSLVLCAFRCHECALSVPRVGTECAKGGHRVCHGCAISESSAGDG